MSIGKILKTLSVATLSNVITAYIASDQLGKAFENIGKAKFNQDMNEHIRDILVPIFAGFTLSTAPAIAMTVITKILSLDSTTGTLAGGVVTSFGYDQYLNFACPKKYLISEVGD